MSRPEWPELPEGVQAEDFRLVLSADVTLGPHEPSRECDEVHCYWHHVDEPPPEGGDYRVCYECKHGFRTAAELLDTFNQVMLQADAEASAHGWAPLEFVPVDDVEQIFFCPFCTHDF